MYIIGSGFIGKSINERFKDSDLISIRKLPKKIKLNKYKTLVICCGISRLVKNDSSILYSEIKKIDWIISNFKKHNLNKVILLSTIDLYSKNKRLINEETPTEISDYYTLTQLLYEKSMTDFFKKKLMILRLTGVYGALDNKNSSISKMINQALFSDTIYLSNHKIQRDYIYIDDFLNIFKKIINKKYYGILNIGSFESQSVLSYAKMVSKITGKKIIKEPIRKNLRTYNVQIDSEKLNSLIGFYNHNHENNIKELIRIRKS